ncbi:MAG: DUF2066 domain-containing protein [Alphaproteobacteria bacterium]|nr:DUF2066 domain-containing protein [Alphaproteobacteria bacterium]
MQLLTMFACGRRFGAVLAILGLLLQGFTVSPAMAQGVDDLYAVHGVDVDITSDNAAAARDKAIAQGQRDALGQLLARMGANVDLSDLTDDDIANLVQDFEILNERTSSVRYLATFTVRFKQNDIRQMLQNGGISYSELRSKPVLVLPVMPSNGRAVLWEEPTPWRAAWDNAARHDGLVPLVVPTGELSDIAIVGTNEVMQGDAAALAKAATAYDTGGIIVPIVEGNKVDPEKPLEITIKRYDAAGEAASPVAITIPAMPGQDAETMLYAAVTKIRDQLERGWKQATRVSASGAAVRLPVRVPIQSLQDWAVMRQRLTKVPLVNKVDVITLTRDSAHIEVIFQGDVNQLRIALAQYDLALHQAAGAGAWELRSER